MMTNVCSNVTAFCWPTGLVEVADVAPQGSVAFAKGPETELTDLLDVVCRHGYKKGQLLIPGIPEADNQDVALEALEGFISWLNKTRTDERITFKLEFV